MIMQVMLSLHVIGARVPWRERNVDENRKCG